MTLRHKEAEMKKFAENIPIYLQLKTEVEDAILNASLRAEDAIDSIRAMAAKYSINPLTVSKAIQELEDEGVIYKKRGIGFYVTPDAQESLRRKHMQTYLETEVKTFVRKARQLGIGLQDIIKLISENFEEDKDGEQ
jgi:GntR family transcriptional regulator